MTITRYGLLAPSADQVRPLQRIVDEIRDLVDDGCAISRATVTNEILAYEPSDEDFVTCVDVVARDYTSISRVGLTREIFFNTGHTVYTVYLGEGAQIVDAYERLFEDEPSSHAPGCPEGGHGDPGGSLVFCPGCFT